jgi:hypothetical protein
MSPYSHDSYPSCRMTNKPTVFQNKVYLFEFRGCVLDFNLKLELGKNHFFARKK